MNRYQAHPQGDGFRQVSLGEFLRTLLFAVIAVPVGWLGIVTFLVLFEGGPR